MPIVVALMAACQPGPVEGGKAERVGADPKVAVQAGGNAERTIFYMGHSLLSDIPDMTLAMAQASGNGFTFKDQNIPGAPLRWQWEEATREKKAQFEPQFQGHYFNVLSDKTTDFVLTDSVPRGGEDLVKETIDYLGRFQKYAKERNPRVQLWYYETWHCIDSGTEKGCAYDNASPTRNLRWRERLLADRPMWERIAREAGQGIRLIPAGTGLAKLTDAIRKGEVPGFASERDLFHDEIHLSRGGQYFVALVHYAALFQKSPVGLPYDIKDRWGRRFWETANWDGKVWPLPDAQAVKRMQEIAWEVVQNDPWTRPRS